MSGGEYLYINIGESRCKEPLYNIIEVNRPEVKRPEVKAPIPNGMLWTCQSSHAWTLLMYRVYYFSNAFSPLLTTKFPLLLITNALSLYCLPMYFLYCLYTNGCSLFITNACVLYGWSTQFTSILLIITFLCCSTI